jgi:hypothetical protein
MTSLLHCSGECNRVTPVQKRARRQAFQEPRERHENVRLLSDVIAMMCRLGLTDRLSGSGLAGSAVASSAAGGKRRNVPTSDRGNDLGSQEPARGRQGAMNGYAYT